MDQIEILFNTLGQANILSISPWDSKSIIWHEKGLKIRNNYIKLIKENFLASNYSEFLFPAIIPETLLAKQYEHYRDISKISFPLFENSKSYLRSTSESQFASYVSSIIYKNRPIKMFQECSVFRKETKDQIIPLLRDIEINPFIEFMTFSQDSQTEIENEIKIFSNILNSLCLPTFYSSRPKWDTFPEANKTIAFDFPINNLGFYQLASTHDLSNSFSKVFNIVDNNGYYLSQTSSGISGRALIATIIEHFRYPSIILPSCLSPYLIGIHEELFNRNNLFLEKSNLNKLLIAKNYDELRGYNPILPIIIKSIDRKYLLLEDHLNNEFKINKKNINNEVSEFIDHFDNKLRENSTARFTENLKSKNLLFQFPSCGNLLCIRKKIAPHVNYKLLGFNNLPKAINNCDYCNEIESYQTRLENVC